jgi:Arc/MetJ-type ribon-helix-helix transcriptional regulator
MSRLSIALADDDIDWARGRVADGAFASVDSYFSELAKRDRAEIEEAAWLQREIDKGLASGIDPRAPKHVFSDVRARYFGPDG